MTDYRKLLYEKMAISLPSHAAESVRRAVREGRAASVSAYIAEAIQQKSSREDLIAMLDDAIEKSGGPITDAEQRWVDWQLGSRRGKEPARAPRLQPQRKRRRRPAK